MCCFVYVFLFYRQTTADKASRCGSVAIDRRRVLASPHTTLRLFGKLYFGAEEDSEDETHACLISTHRYICQAKEIVQMFLKLGHMRY